MVGIVLHVEEIDYRLFRDLVGKGNIARTLRNYVKAYAKSDDLNEVVLKKRFELVTAEKAKVDAEYFSLKETLDAIEAKREAGELERLEKEKALVEQMSKIKHDTVKAGIARRVMGK